MFKKGNFKALKALILLKKKCDRRIKTSTYADGRKKRGKYEEG